jgi:hypothetical protein
METYSYSIALILSQITTSETNSAALPTTYLPAGRWRPTQTYLQHSDRIKNSCVQLKTVFRIRIHMFLGLMDPDLDLLVRGMDPDPDPSIIKQKY